MLQYARTRGIAVDKAIELYHAGTLDMASLDPVVIPFFEAYLKFLDENNNYKFISAKQRRYSNLGYAGEIDLIFESPSGYWITDIKVTSKLYPSVRYQLAGYAGLYKSESNRMALLLKKDGKYKVEAYCDPEDWEIFSNALNCYQKFNKESHAKV